MCNGSLQRAMLNEASDYNWRLEDIDKILEMLPEYKRDFVRCKIYCYGIDMFYSGMICELSGKK